MLRFKRKEPRIGKNELLQLAQDTETWLLEFEAKQLGAGVIPDERQTEAFIPRYTSTTDHKTEQEQKRNMDDRLGERRGDLRERLGERGETRKRNGCGVIGHLVVNCPNVARNAPPPPAPRGQPVATGLRTTHKTEGATCTACNKTGHVEAQCWSKHPEKLPSDYAKERGQQMTQINRKRQKAAEYTSPGYQCQGQGMALTYKRPAAAMMQRRSARVSCYITLCPVHTCNHRLITIFVLCVLSTRANIM